MPLSGNGNPVVAERPSMSNGPEKGRKGFKKERRQPVGEKQKPESAGGQTEK